jgi:hypothetical protein
MSVSFQTLFAACSHLSEGQLLSEETAINRGKSRKFQIGTLTPAGSSKEGQHLKHC